MTHSRKHTRLGPERWRLIGDGPKLSPNSGAPSRSTQTVPAHTISMDLRCLCRENVSTRRSRNYVSLAQYQKTIQRDPNFGPAHFKLSHLYAATGRYEDAVGETKKMTQLAPLVTTPDAKGYCAANQAIRGADRDISSAIACARTDQKPAIRLLQAAYENHDLVGEFVRSPEFDSLRSDPHYTDVMHKMGLEP